MDGGQSVQFETSSFASGSWHAVHGADSMGGDAYCTSMAVLSLTVPYRYLPIYQR